MKLDHLFLFHAFFAFLYGLAAVIAPHWLTNLLAFEPIGPIGANAAQYMGSLLLGVAVLGWLGRRSTDTGSRRTMALSLFVYSAVAAIVAWIAQFSGAWRPIEWFTVALLTIWALGYLYFLFVKPDGVAASAANAR